MSQRWFWSVAVSHGLLLAAFLAGPVLLAPFVLLSAYGWWRTRNGTGKMVSFVATLAGEAVAVVLEAPLWPLLGATAVLLPLLTASPSTRTLPLVLTGLLGFGLAALGSLLRIDLPFGMTFLAAGIVLIALDQLGKLLRKEGHHGHL